MQLKRFDNYFVGIVLGLLVPFVFGYLFYYRMDLDMLVALGDNAVKNAVLGKMMIVCVFPNLAQIFIFYAFEFWTAAKGIAIATLPYFLACIWFMVS